MSFKYYISLCFLLVVIASCKKYEEEPVEFITKDYVYDQMDKNGDYARRIVNHLYTYLPQGFNRIDHVVLGAATDDAISSDHYNNIEILSKSRLTSVSSNPDGYWYRGYEAIRNVNLFLANIGVVPVDSVTKQYWRAEARFIRAFSYFELIKRYGGVPIVGNDLFPQNAEIDIPRKSYDACVSYIVNELDDIRDSLRKDPVKSTEIGRITKGADMALKSRVLLYAASPLNNPDDDLNKWQAAANAAKDLIDYHQFSLDPDYINLFINRESKGVILAYQRAQTADLEHQNAPVGYADLNLSQGYVSPTQELVDAFPMNNGKSISASGSGYLPNKPYLNRDPRFYATIFYNGDMWLNRKVQTYEGGLDKPNNVQRQTRTGYYMRKFLADFSNKSDYSKQDHNFIIFRYGGILLNYAEAENELGNTSPAYDQLKALRKRAGIKAGNDDMYGLKKNMSQDEMRKAIHHERRIEMAFEEQRFWDVRRWGIADSVFNQELHGVEITKQAGGTFDYQTVPVFQMSYKPKMDLYPIPYKEIGANAAITQNPGWSH